MTLGPHLLGRTRPPDSRHLDAYPLEAEVPPQGIEVNIKRPAHFYDQGQTPRCVGYSITKVVNHFNGYIFDPDWLYARCKEIDGDPAGDGTSARYACDVLRRLGHLRMISGKDVKAGPNVKHGIASNRWAMGVDDIRAAFAQAKPEPVPIGIDWYQAWFQPQYLHPASGAEYWLRDIPAAGPIAGGHEIGVWACSDRRQAFGLSNTWSLDLFPELVWMPYTTMTRLFRQGADACVITDLPTR
jgi:hypothetical protein